VDDLYTRFKIHLQENVELRAQILLRGQLNYTFLKINRIKIDENFYAYWTKVGIIYSGGKHGRNLENPPHSPMEEGSATFS